MRFSKFLKVSALLGFSALTLTACSSNKKEASSKEVHWTELAEMPTTDLSKATDTVSFSTMNNVFEGLYRLGKDSKIEPGLAKSTTVSPDGLTYTFNLRKGAKWSNGDPVTAKDFVFSWQRTVDPKTASEYSYLFDGVKNADEITKGKKAPSELGVKADGDYKLVVTLDHQVPYFKLLMGFPTFFPQNQKAVKEYGDKYGTASKYMVYNGPFKLAKWTGTNLSWELDKNDSYWDKNAVKLDKVTFKVNKANTTAYNLYQSGKLDFTYLDSEQIRQLKTKPEFKELSLGATAYLKFNTEKKKELANKKIRQAIELSINKKELIDKVLGAGRDPKGFVPQNLAKMNGKDFADEAYNKKGVGYDPKEAQKLWSEGLKELGTSELSFSLLGDDIEASKKASEFMQSQIESNLKGAKVTVQNVPFKTRLQRDSKGEFDVQATGWGADFSDPITFLNLYTSDNPMNTGKYKNDEFDKLVKETNTTDAGNKDVRWTKLLKAEQLLMEDQAMGPLYQKYRGSLMKSKVKNVVYNSAGANWNFKEAYVEK